jgi:hypothetical protein
LLGAALLSARSTAAAADKGGDGPFVIVKNVHQYSGGDIFNVGRDNFVGSGSGNGAQQSGVGAPGANPAAVRIMTGTRVPFSGVLLASPEGSEDYSRAIYPNLRRSGSIDGPSVTVYRSEGGAGQVRITATVTPNGTARPNCADEGSLECRVDCDVQGQFLRIDGR